MNRQAILFTSVPVARLTWCEMAIERLLPVTRMGALLDGEYVFRYWDWDVAR